MASPTQFRHYLISQDEAGNNIEISRSDDQISVLAFDIVSLTFVHCHVLLEPLKNETFFKDRLSKLAGTGDSRLARVVDFGKDDDSAFYIAENVDGELLETYLSRDKKLPVWMAMSLTLHALEAVETLQTKGHPAPHLPLHSMRVVQTGAHSLNVVISEYEVTEEVEKKSLRGKTALSAFQKQIQFLTVYFKEHLENRSAGHEEALLQTAEFSALLHNLLSSCPAESQAHTTTLKTFLKTSEEEQPQGEISAPLKPRALIAPMLATFQDVARNVMQSVRIQSQKLDANQPYALRGVLTKTGQDIFVEQTAPHRMIGDAPRDLIQQAQSLPSAGKYPNLVPIVLREKTDEMECVGEAAVEGISLQELLELRKTLNIHETYLVLAGVDAALTQLEKANLGTRRLRLEDIFLFTGFSRKSPKESGLLTQPLNEWPGFSIVLRTHPTLHAMVGRGTDPARLLPLEIKIKGDIEPVWHGSWIAALGCFLVGMPTGDAQRHETGLPEFDSIYKLLAAELKRASVNNPSNRSTFLTQYARVMQQFDQTQLTKPGGFWTEVSGTATAQGHAAEVARAATVLPTKRTLPISSAPVVPPPAPAPVAAPRPAPIFNPPAEPENDDEPDSHLGFAEALISPADVAQHSHPLFHQTQTPQSSGRAEPTDSSWTTLHEAWTFRSKVLLLLITSMILGAVLAHLSQRAFWQSWIPASLEKPVREAQEATPPAESSVPSLVPPKAIAVDDLDLDAVKPAAKPPANTPKKELVIPRAIPVD